MNENTVVVRHEWMDTVLDIIHFFLRHSSIEYDGAKQTARVKYNGPNGWKVSLDTSFDPGFEEAEYLEVEEKWHD